MKSVLIISSLVLGAMSPTFAADVFVYVPLETTLTIGKGADYVQITCFRREIYRCDLPPTEYKPAYTTYEYGRIHHFLPASGSIVVEGIEFRCHQQQQQQCQMQQQGHSH